MRPLSLTMCAFGPFQAVQTIPFERLGASPLFLINGPTGSGKTTILDAICFALYGRTTGDEREGSQMRCDHAAADTLTEVTFSFALAGRGYRIRRVPEQPRPKARGEGTTTQSAEAQLWAIDPAGDERLLVPSKVTEATREIERLTGLSVEQFRQVMVLPQGKFRELLLAESRQREEIFSQLFQTRIYRQLEERLKVQSAEIRREVEQERKIQQAILQGVGLESPALLHGTLQALQPELEQALSQREAAEKQYGEAQAALQGGQYLQRGFARLAELQQQQAALNRQQQEINGHRQRLQLAEQAGRLKPLSDRHVAADQILQTSMHKRQQAVEVQERAKQLLAESELALKGHEASSATLDRRKGQLATLQGYQQRAMRLDKAIKDLQQAETVARKTEDTQQLKQSELQQIAQQRQQLDRDRLEQQAQLDQSSDAPLQLKQVSDQRRDRQVLEQLIAQRVRLDSAMRRDEQAGKRLAAEHQTCADTARRIELAWHQGQAALLARELESDHPCPVCGSREHPAPAQSDRDLPSQAALEQARQAVQEIQEQLNRERETYVIKKSELKGVTARIAELEQQLGPAKDESLQQLTTREQRLRQSVKCLDAARQRLQEIESDERQQKQLEGQCRAELETLNVQLMTQRAELAAARSDLQAAEQELPVAYREPGALEQAIRDTGAEIARLDQVINEARSKYQRDSSAYAAAKATSESAAESQVSAEAAVRQAEGEWTIALGASPFADLAAFEQALLTEDKRSRLQKVVRDYEQTTQQTAGALQQQQAALEGRAAPDIPALERQLASAVERRKNTDQAWRQLDKREDELQRATARLGDNQRRCATLEQQYALVGTLSDVANGQTGDKVSLQRFVLSVLLDDVLVEASRRLHLMSKGRYQLLRKSERAKGNRASGLDLEVEDAYTGKCRPVATLSGGESFLAALSLALGLSDVVQAYSGGIRLDTLFIDEGFGSLDPESLDLAIRALVDLQSSGRMIGVISHVAELKEQMSLRLDIHSSRQGSQVKLVTL